MKNLKPTKLSSKKKEVKRNNFFFQGEEECDEDIAGDAVVGDDVVVNF